MKRNFEYFVLLVFPGSLIRTIIDAAEALLRQDKRSWHGYHQKEYYYDDIKIGRSDGGKPRSISRPSPKLLNLQRALLSHGIKDIPVHHSATAYRKGASIGLNARRHAAQAYVFKTDIVNFFPSISPLSIIDEILEHLVGLPSELKSELCTVLSLGGGLPTGAPTSPYLSNVFMRNFDEKISAIAKSNKLNDTRYSDDITLSGKSEIAVDRLSEVMISAINEIGLIVNLSKTKKLGPKDRKIVTGLDVTTHYIRPTRKFRRRTRNLIRMFGKFEKSGLEMPIRGRLSFWNGITPLDPELLELCEHFTDLRVRMQRRIEKENRLKSLSW